MTLTAAKSQRAEDRPISFILDARGGVTEEVTLFIRPEELTRTHQSRTSVNQTMGGAWIDSFGEGLENTTLSGTLGWRTDPSGLDGGDRLIDMRNKTFHRWHELRDEAVNRGDDPNDVKLRFVDVLNDYSAVIVPLTFEIRRSKSQPLLAKYRISFVSVGRLGAPSAIAEAVDELVSGPTASSKKSGLDSLFASIKRINDAIKSVKNFIDKNIIGPVKNFMALAVKVFTAVRDTIDNIRGIADSLVSVAHGIAQAGANIFRTFAALASLPGQIKADLMRVAGAFSNIFCVLKNSLKKTTTYEDYSALYGASNCSSTSGGRAPSLYADQNALLAVSQSTPSPVTVSDTAAGAIRTLASKDIVVAPMSTTAIGASLSDINAGVVVK